MTPTVANGLLSTTPFNGWQLFHLLAKGEWMPGSAWRVPSYRRKFVLRSLITPFATMNLLTSLAQQPLLRKIIAVQPGLPCRAHRPYLTVHFNRKATLDALSSHYQALTTTLPESLLLQHYSARGARLATITGKDSCSYHLHLRSIANFDKEGEATFVFTNQDSTALAWLTFTLCQYQGKSTLLIGGLQGAKSEIPHEVIQSATKACHGLFPKRLLLEAACQLANHLAAEQILAVSNSTHVYRTRRYQHKKKGMLLSDYDGFWRSMSGELQPDGLFRMPLNVARRPMADIASKKRAEYRRRYDLLDDLVAQVEDKF